MPTPRPFNAPTSFVPRFNPGGLFARSQEQAMRDAQAGAARIKANQPTPPASSGINPLSALGSFFNPLSPQGAILGLTQLEGSSPAPVDSPARREAMARYAAKSGMFGKYGAENVPFKVPVMSTPAASPAPAAKSFNAAAVAPRERAYLEEKSRIAQLTAQDPELQRYEAARKLAAAKGATPEQEKAAEDIGMQIWAKKYGGLAEKVKPGQAGYDVIQKTLYPQGAPLPPLSEASQAMLNEIAPANAQGVRENIVPMPGQGPVFGTESEAMYQAVTGGGKFLTPMPSPQAKTVQAAQATAPEAAQDLSDAYKSAVLGTDEFAQRLRAMQQYLQ